MLNNKEISCAQLVQDKIDALNTSAKNANNAILVEQALKQAQEAYGLFIWFIKWFSYIMIFLIILMFMNNWFDDGTGSMFMPDEIYEDQYDPQGLNKRKGI